MQLYWHRTLPNYASLQTVPENRVYISPDRADDFVRDFVECTSVVTAIPRPWFPPAGDQLGGCVGLGLGTVGPRSTTLASHDW